MRFDKAKGRLKNARKRELKITEWGGKRGRTEDKYNGSVFSDLFTASTS